MTRHSQKVALFGANGRVGKAILNALLRCKEQSFDIVVIISPQSTFKLLGNKRLITVHKLDLITATVEDILLILQGVEVVVSALGGSCLDRQQSIQDAAALAGVRRFYPSEFGICQIPILPGNEPLAHPTWIQKIQCLDNAIHHPAITSGKITYTVIGCGEMYDMPGESMLCPWLDDNASEYVIPVVGDPDALMDYSSLHDVAGFLVSSICHPALAENKILGFRGDHISFSDVARSLQRHSGKPVSLDIVSFEDAVEWVKDSSRIPSSFNLDTQFPADFLLLLRYAQGWGRCCRPPGLFHDGLFGGFKPLSVDAYFEGLFGKTA